jgi:hypothetical protein
MAAPLLVPIAIAVSRALAAAAAKQGVKKLAAKEAQQVVRQVAARRGIRSVSDKEARMIASKAVGRNPIGRTPSKVRGAKTGPVARIDAKKTTVSTPMKRAGKTKTDSPVTTRMQEKRTTPKDVLDARDKARYERISKALTPIKPRGTKSGGKAMLGPKPNSSTVTVAKKGPAAERNKAINPSDRRLDESRRTGMKNAGDRTKTAKERELEQRPDLGRVSSPKPKDAAQREADKRVAEGLKKIGKGKKARPEMPKTKARAPKYPESTKARFRRQTGAQ